MGLRRDCESFFDGRTVPPQVHYTGYQVGTVSAFSRVVTPRGGASHHPAVQIDRTSRKALQRREVNGAPGPAPSLKPN
jgi:hypothetical protein